MAFARTTVTRRATTATAAVAVLLLLALLPLAAVAQLTPVGEVTDHPAPSASKLQQQPPPGASDALNHAAARAGASDALNHGAAETAPLPSEGDLGDTATQQSLFNW